MDHHAHHQMMPNDGRAGDPAMQGAPDEMGDGSNSGGMSMSHTMNMVFNWNTETTILFSFWQTAGAGSMFISCILVFLMAYGHEWFQAYRLHEERRFSHFDKMDDVELESNDAKPRVASQSRHQDSRRMQRTLHYAISTFSSLLIMTVFMSLNGWLVLSILSGTAFGYYSFNADTAKAKPSLACH